MRSLILGSLLIGSASAAAAQSSEIPYEPNLIGQTVSCDDFSHDGDGTWTTVRPISVQRRNEYRKIAAGTSFREGGQPVAGLDVAAALAKSCPR